jgi:hypothetical protein
VCCEPLAVSVVVLSVVVLCVVVDGACDPVVLCDDEEEGHCDPLCEPLCELPVVELSCATMLPASNRLEAKINQLFLITKSPLRFRLPGTRI